jgi:hypothetical protein
LPCFVRFRMMCLNCYQSGIPGRWTPVEKQNITLWKHITHKMTAILHLISNWSGINQRDHLNPISVLTHNSISLHDWFKREEPFDSQILPTFTNFPVASHSRKLINSVWFLISRQRSLRVLSRFRFHNLSSYPPHTFNQHKSEGMIGSAFLFAKAGEYGDRSISSGEFKLGLSLLRGI